MRTKNKILFIIIACILILVFIQQTCMATNTTIDTDIKIGTTNAAKSTKTFTENILGYLQAIGSVVSVVALAIIGFRYMFSGFEEKAKMKGVIPYYIAGAVLVFATTTVLSLVYDAMNEIGTAYDSAGIENTQEEG